MRSRTTPERSDPQQAYFDLKMPDVFLMSWFRALRSSCDLTTEKQVIVEVPGVLTPGVSDFRPEFEVVRSPVVVAFSRQFLANAEKRGIPLFMPWCARDAGMILHGWYKDDMSPLHWDAYEAVGNDVARSGNHHVEHIGMGVWQERNRMRRPNFVR